MDAGGGLCRSSGSRPTRYCTPVARVSAPRNNRVTWKLEGQMYGYSEPLYNYEDFHGNTFLTTLRFHL